MQIPWRSAGLGVGMECQLDDHMWAYVNKPVCSWTVYRQQERLATGSCETLQAAQKRAEIVMRALAVEEH